MSYNQYPSQSLVFMRIFDHSHEAHVQQSPHSVPVKIEDWLLGIGWTYTMQDPNTHEALFQKHGDRDVDTMYYRWYEACAYEFWRFITINSGNDT